MNALLNGLLEVSSITFGRYRFYGITPLVAWVPPRIAGIYAISTPNSGWQPIPYEPIYFGESADLSDRGFATHHARPAWIRAAGSESKLYVSVLSMPGSSESERRQIESQLITSYQPDANIAGRNMLLGAGRADPAITAVVNALIVRK